MAQIGAPWHYSSADLGQGRTQGERTTGPAVPERDPIGFKAPIVVAAR
jgi:hypothetical protein